MTKKSRYNLNINSNYPALYQQSKVLKAFTGGGGRNPQAKTERLNALLAQIITITDNPALKLWRSSDVV
ncbi:hypothetical protein [Bombilactobacillus mellifer]|uniref:hypothetical protein n=1 Tax=Bombilactobacillus mellifer TaxID=1218492 RepID=UPI003609C487